MPETMDERLIELARWPSGYRLCRVVDNSYFAETLQQLVHQAPTESIDTEWLHDALVFTLLDPDGLVQAMLDAQLPESGSHAGKLYVGWLAWRSGKRLPERVAAHILCWLYEVASVGDAVEFNQRLAPHLGLSGGQPIAEAVEEILDRHDVDLDGFMTRFEPEVYHLLNQPPPDFQEVGSLVHAAASDSQPDGW